jgi:hypothetical protein
LPVGQVKRAFGQRLNAGPNGRAGLRRQQIHSRLRSEKPARHHGAGRGGIACQGLVKDPLGGVLDFIR